MEAYGRSSRSLAGSEVSTGNRGLQPVQIRITQVGIPRPTSCLLACLSLISVHNSQRTANSANSLCTSAPLWPLPPRGPITDTGPPAPRGLSSPYWGLGEQVGIHSGFVQLRFYDLHVQLAAPRAQHFVAGHEVLTICGHTHTHKKRGIPARLLKVLAFINIQPVRPVHRTHVHTRTRHTLNAKDRAQDLCILA